MINEIIFCEITVIFIKVFVMNNIQNTLSFLSFNQIVQTPITTKNSITVLYFILRINHLFSRSQKLVTNFMWHDQTKRIIVFSHVFIQISVTHPMSSFTFDTVEIYYSTFFFSYLIWKSISGEDASEMFYFQIVNPFFKIKI